MTDIIANNSRHHPRHQHYSSSILPARPLPPVAVPPSHPPPLPRPMSQPAMATRPSFHDEDVTSATRHHQQQQQQQQQPQHHQQTNTPLSTYNPLPTPSSSSGTPITTNRPPPIKRRRAASIDTDEANHLHHNSRIQDHGLYTPNSNSLIAFTNHDGPRDLICLCTKAPKVPRPRNAFILYRQHHQGQVAAQNPGLANPEISKLIGQQWREQPEEVKASWKQLAEEEKVRHQRQYPDYRYQPRRGGKGGANGNKVASASGEDPGRCAKCGGRYIATPRTPTTPFTAATPPIVAKSAIMPSYINPNPRVMETDHLRRGSTASMMSVDSHGRRYTQPHLREIEEDYSMMSPSAAPDPKRRRYNPPNGYMPTSPPMGYMHANDHHYQRPSVSAASMPGGPAGFASGPGPLPRPGMGHYRQPSNASMQPPPRPSISYQVGPIPPRPDTGFDESLRLPPLQTQLPNSPTMNGDNGNSLITPASTPAHGTGLGIMNGGGGTPSSRQPMPPRWQFLLKLDMLRAISPPLKPPGPGAPPFETRGPIIAVEGFSPSILKEVTSVVEKALSISGECAVRIWSDDDQPWPREANGESPKGTPRSDQSNELSVHGDFASPLANYVAKMLKWHHTSEELVQYIVHHPPQPHNESGNSPSPTRKCLLPVAVISTGYSLTISDRYAAALPITDAYRHEDHWRWVATLWRGLVGADLTLYVKKCGEDEIKGNNCVEFANPGVVILRLPEGRNSIDEKLERRLGFEIMEWVRSGSFKNGVRKG